MPKGSDSVEICHLRYVVAAADHGCFRKASIALGICQSTMSRLVYDLEARLGASLFHRRTCGVLLTHAGKHFVRRARHALKIIQEGTQSVASVGRGEEGEVRIGIFSSLVSGFLRDLLRAYGEKDRDVRIDLVDGDQAEHIPAVRELRLDIAFVTGNASWSGCESARLWSERVFVVLPLGHPLTLKDELVWADLADECFIVSDVARGQKFMITSYRGWPRSVIGYEFSRNSLAATILCRWLLWIAG